MLSAIFAQAADPASAEQLTRDSAILGEQFYFFTVVLMWLIHAGFMSYEAGIARRKNVMATAMKNILTIAVPACRSARTRATSPPSPARPASHGATPWDRTSRTTST